MYIIMRFISTLLIIIIIIILTIYLQMSPLRSGCLQMTVSCTDLSTKLMINLPCSVIWTPLSSNKWGMKFNAKKCESIRMCWKRNSFTNLYTIIGQILQGVSSARYLAVNITKNLTGAFTTNGPTSSSSICHQ